MKNYVVILAAMWIALFSSCEQNPKEISPSGTKFTHGALAELVELDTLPAMLSYEAPENGTTHVFRMTVKMILKKESPCLQKADQKKISFDGGNIALNLLDENGTKATAATIVETKAQTLPKFVKLNRPFIYAIVDNATGLPLFIGTVVNLAG